MKPISGGSRIGQIGGYMRQRKGSSLLLALTAASLISAVSPASVQAYPPRLPLVISSDNTILTPKTGKSILNFRHACPGAARVLVNGVGYRALNASRGYGTFSFGPVNPGKYTVTVKSCTEDASTVLYVPGALIIPQKHITPRRLALYMKYVPPGSLVSFLLAGKRVATVPSVRPNSSGIAKLTLPANTLKLGKNSVTLMVGTRVKINAVILGISAPN